MKALFDNSERFLIRNNKKFVVDSSASDTVSSHSSNSDFQDKSWYKTDENERYQALYRGASKKMTRAMSELEHKTEKNSKGIEPDKLI